MARIVLGIGTSHTPVLSIPGELWASYAERDRQNPELMFPPEGVQMPFDVALATHVPREIQERVGNEAIFKEQFDRCQTALDTLAGALDAAKPDFTVIVSDDQDEWFFEDNMPVFAVYWDSMVPLRPREAPPDAPEYLRHLLAGYGDVPLEIPVPSGFGRHLVEHLMDEDFDVAHVSYMKDVRGGRIARRYPALDGELDLVRDTPERTVGLPHGFAFVVKRLFDNEPRPILPVFQNTCYPPNNVRPARAYDFGRAIASAISAWEPDARVAVVCSGGLSHFVVDEELDRDLLDALVKKDAAALRSLPRHRLYSATSESLNWVTLGGVMADVDLQADVVDYVPGYRSVAGTGGGWAFMRWH